VPVSGEEEGTDFFLADLWGGNSVAQNPSGAFSFVKEATCLLSSKVHLNSLNFLCQKPFLLV